MAPRTHTLPLILAIDGDRRRRADIAGLIDERLTADLCQAATAEDAIAQLQGRVPDLILTSPLLSPREEDAIAMHLRTLGDSAAHVQTIRIPVLRCTTASAAPEPRGFFARFLAPEPEPPQGCDPHVFAEEIVQYLSRAAAARDRAAGTCDEAAAGSLPHVSIATPAAGDEEQSPLALEFASERELAGTPPFTLLSLDEFLKTTPAARAAAEPGRHRNVAPPADAGPAGSDPILSDFQDALLALEHDVGSARLMLLDAGGPTAPEAQIDPLAAFASEADIELPVAPHDLASSPATDGHELPQEPAIERGAREADADATASVADPSPADAVALREWTTPDTPMQDEWGVFDPDRCGFAALVARLDRFSREDQ